MARTKKEPTLEDRVNSGYIDLTKTGPLSYKELRELNSGLPQESTINSRTPDNIGVLSTLQRAGKVNYTEQPTGLGKSIYDPGVANQEQIENLDDYRAEAQPWYAQIGAGLAKGVILAGTTFLDGTVGLLFGGAEAIARGDISGLWDNEFSRAMQSVNDWSEEFLPNYYSQNELNSPWYENIFTANFLGDKFIKNLGFSVGALYSGGVTAAGLKLTKLPQLIGAIAKSTKAPAMVSSAVGSVVSAVNEGRIEALNNSRDWQNLKLQELDDAWKEQIKEAYSPQIESLQAEYDAALAEYEATKGNLKRVGTGDMVSWIDPAAQIYDEKLKALDARRVAIESSMASDWENRASDERYNKVIGKIEEDRLKMGNTDLLLNIPILTASNMVQFTKFYANGFNTARKAGVSAVRDASGAIRYTPKAFSKGKAALKITQGAIAEGTEEISQKAASLISGDYYSTDVNNYYKSQMDENAEQETLDWMKSVASGINETVNDGSSWEEFFIGALTGMLGVPSFRSIRNENGQLRLPIKLEGGAVNTYREYQQEIARSEEVANYLNQRVQSPEFLNYYRGMIRHNKYQNDMNSAVEEGDEFNFKNAEHAQFVSDITMFDNAGRLEDLRTFIDSAYDISDENLASIVENTTSTDESGKKIGPFVDNNGNPMYSTEEGKKQMIDKLTKTRDSMIKTIENYRTTKNDIDSMTGGSLSDEQLSEMTWIKTQIDDWSQRAKDMIPLVKKTLTNLRDNLETTLSQSLADASMEESPETASETMSVISKVANQLGIGTDRIKQIQTLANLSDKRLEAILTNPKNTRFVEGVISDIDQFGSDIISSLDKQRVVQLLGDLPRIGKGMEIYNSRLEEYLASPDKQAADQKKATEELQEQIQKKKNSSIKDRLLSSSSLEEFRGILLEEEDLTTRDTVLKELGEDGNAIAKNYKETELYDAELRKALTQQGESAETLEDALTLWDSQYKNAENLEQIANPNSIYVNNDTAFDEASEGDAILSNERFEAARYALQKAMSKVNNSIKFKDRFSPEYMKPVDEVAKGKGTSKSTTGDSGTSTVPHVNPEGMIPVAPIPVGNITHNMVADENKSSNERVDTQTDLDRGQQGQRKYYRPAIPELHIEASKEGDFRPFDVVVGEREKGVDFSGIYSYLRDAGAFSYVNAAKLKPGDILGFMIDPDFSETTIFIVDTRNKQIVGSIDESDRSIARYEGLEELIKKVKDEYQESKNSKKSAPSVDEVKETLLKGGVRGKAEYMFQEGSENLKNTPQEGKTIEDWDKALSDISLLISKLIEKGYSKDQLLGALGNRASWQLLLISGADVLGNLQAIIKDAGISDAQSKKFFATPQTRVSKMMVGRIPYSTEERNLADTPGILDGGSTPIFGIIKNGTLTTNGKVDDRLIIKPVDMSQKEGRLYLLIPNAAGTYSPAAVRVKHFNTQEFNIDDATVASTPIGKSINDAIDKLADASSQDDVSIAMKELSQDLYMQDVMVTWFDAKAGSGIVISRKVRKPDGTYEMVTIDGKEQIKENKYTIYFQSSKKTAEVNGLEYTYEAAKDAGVDMSIFGQPRDISDIRKDILSTIIRFNLPLQVSTSRFNETGYNNRIIKSGILTSNLIEAKVIGSWFTTDYFDKQGNIQQAISPASVKPAPGRKTVSPVGGTEGVTRGTKISMNGTTYIVDLKSSIYTDSNGARHAATSSNMAIFEMAWAQETFGDSTESSTMVDNKVITPRGLVLDRSTGKYLPTNEALKILDRISKKNQGNEELIAKSERVIADIYENQNRVDKTRTDGEFYYILEDDGEYHEYSRVHSRLGENWIQSDRQAAALRDIRVELSRLVDNPQLFNGYLDKLAAKYKQYALDFSSFKGKTDAKSRDIIVNMIRDKMSGTNSQRALDVGSSIDSVIRDFFTSSSVPARPSNISEIAFSNLISRLLEIKTRMATMGETFLTDNIVLFQKYPDGTRVAGEVDILSIDKDGNFKIYDVKTSRYSFYDFQDRYGHIVNYFENKSNTQIMSSKDYYTLQLSAYKNLFESQYGVPIRNLAILPFVLSYNRDTVSDIKVEKGIPITYNPAVNVPLSISVSSQSQPQTKGLTLAIFDSSVETMSPENRVLPENAFEEGGEIGYYEKDGKLYSGTLKKIGDISGVPVYVTKVRDRGFGRNGELGSTSEYLTVFPNGKAISTRTNSSSDTEAITLIKKALEGKPDKVVSLASEKTQISDGYNPKAQAEEKSTISDAEQAIQKGDSVNPHDDEFEDELELRTVDDISRPIWNQEKELAWLKEVLPQLSQDDRVKVVEGLIQVAKGGPVAWGMFNKGIITLSNIAAEGTVYHEAFHAVFNLLLDNNDRMSLLKEYRSKHPNMDNFSLVEELAEDFREFVMQGGKDTRSLARKIIDFFKSLFMKTKYWGAFRPSSIYYFKAINNGKYSKESVYLSTEGKLKGKRLWHTSDEIIYRFNKDMPQGYFAQHGGSPRAIFFADRAPESQSFLAERKYKNQYDVVMNNPYVVDSLTSGEYNQDGKHKSMQEAIQYAIDNGYDSVVFKDLYDNMMYGDIYVVFDPAQVNYIAGQDYSGVDYGPSKFRDLPKETWKTLVKKGWTEEQWNRISQAERDQAIECASL